MKPTLTCASLALALACQLITIERANAGSMRPHPDGSIFYMGDVEEGDDWTLARMVVAMKAARITPRLLILGPNGGGDTRVSINMAALLRKEQMETRVEARCPSACATIFAGGYTRTLVKPGRVEVHSARDGDTQAGPNAGENELSRSNTVKLVRFLRRMDVPYPVVGKLVGTPPAQITLVTDDELREWGVEIRR
jgi:hypothetical protein